MGANYYIYAEMKNDKGEWELIPQKMFNRKDNKWEIPPIYWNGSRTYFSESYDKLRSIGKLINKNEISKETLNNYWHDIDDIYDNIVAVPFNKIVNECSNGNKQYSGFVRKNDIFDYENDRIDYFSSLSGKEFNRLSDAAKMDYEYYSWNDPYGWYGIFQIIIENVKTILALYSYVNYLYDLDYANIRILLFASY